MKVHTSIEIPNSNIRLSILEVDNSTAVQFFNNRFQVMVVNKNKNILPKSRKKFLNFKKTTYFYVMNGIDVDEILWYELHLCDKTLEECTTEVLKYLSMYNKGIDIKKVLKKLYNF